MSKIQIKTCDCGNDIELRFHDGVLRAVENPETHIIEDWFVWNCVECGRSYKKLKPETIEI